MPTKNNFQNVGIDENDLSKYCGGIDPIQGCPYTDPSGENGMKECTECCEQNIKDHKCDIDPINCEDICEQHNPNHPTGDGCCRFEENYGCIYMGGTCNHDECEASGFLCYNGESTGCNKCITDNPDYPHPHPHPPNPPPTPYSGLDPWSESDKQKFMNGFPAKISKNEKLCKFRRKIYICTI